MNIPCFYLGFIFIKLIFLNIFLNKIFSSFYYDIKFILFLNIRSFFVYKELVWNAPLQSETEYSLEQTEGSHNSSGTLPNPNPTRELLQVIISNIKKNILYNIIIYNILSHIKNKLKKISGNHCTFIIHGSKMGLLPTPIPIAFEERSIIIARRFLDTTFSSSFSTMVHILEYYRFIRG